MDNTSQEDDSEEHTPLRPEKIRAQVQEAERLAWYQSLTKVEKVEYLGARYFNRHGEPEWEDHNSLYEESEGFSEFLTDK